MRSRILPFLIGIFMLFLGTQSAFSQSGVFDTSFTSPSADTVLGTSDAEFAFSILPDAITDSLDYIIIHAYPQSNPADSAELVTLGTVGPLTDFANSDTSVFINGDDIETSGLTVPGDNYYTIRARAYTDTTNDGSGGRVLNGEITLNVYVDNDAPTVTFQSTSFSGGEPLIAGDTVEFRINDDFLHFSNDDFDLQLDIYSNSNDTTYTLDGSISELLTDGTLIDTTKIDSLTYDFRFLVDLTRYIPNDTLAGQSNVESDQNIALQVTDGAENVTSEVHDPALIIDFTAPDITFDNVDGEDPNEDVIPNSNTGINTLGFIVEDTYLESSLLDTLYNFELVIGDTTSTGVSYSGSYQDHVDAGRLVVSDSLYTFSVNLKPYTQTTGVNIDLNVTDAGGNQTVPGDAAYSGPETIDIVDFITDDYYLLKPYPNTAFNDDFEVELVPKNESDYEGATIQLSASTDFSSPIATLTLDDLIM